MRKGRVNEGKEGKEERETRISRMRRMSRMAIRDSAKTEEEAQVGKTEEWALEGGKLKSGLWR